VPSNCALEIERHDRCEINTPVGVMKIERVLLTAAVLAAFACHGSDNKAVRKDQQYDVVQEGEASGASSTVNAPGEAAPVAGAPLTGTGADTTTNFNSTPGVVSTAGAPAGTLAGTLPPPMPGGSSAPRPMTSSSTVIPTPLPRRIPAQTTQPKQRPEMPPPTTTADDQTTTSSDTTDSTSTSTQPPPGKKKSDEKTDTTSTEPPPPPPPIP
jgi:hypothetical protein